MRLAGLDGRVVFVLGSDDFLPEFVEGKEWYFKEFGRRFYVRAGWSEEDFELVGRANWVNDGFSQRSSGLQFQRGWPKFGVSQPCAHICQCL